MISSESAMRKIAIMTVAAIAIVGLARCEWKDYGIPVWGYEDHDGNCNDRIDNDRDGLIDCEDPDCLATSTYCGKVVPVIPPNIAPETTLRLCHDGIDNDDNGQFDCGDRKCQRILETCCVREATNATCSDGLDNDGNGFADCQDFSCRNGIFVDVCVEDTVALCTDGKDNDGDKRIDCDDSRCRTLIDPATNQLVCKSDAKVEDEHSLAACSDNKDNDQNGYTDCNDFGCTNEDRGASAEAIAYCANRPAEDTLEKCTNGIDDDGNGFQDCNDFSCSDSEDKEIADYCANLGEGTFEKCSDGIDNDGNGYADCADRSCLPCKFPFDDCDQDQVKTAQACVESLSPNSIEANLRCSDGEDNDNDGFIDCQDWDCSHNPQVTICQGPKVCENPR